MSHACLPPVENPVKILRTAGASAATLLQIHICPMRIQRMTAGSAYTSRGYGCGFYSHLILAESKALKKAHSQSM